MATKSRFESFVEERVNELAAPRRAVLKAALDAEVAKIDERFDKFLKMLQQGVDTLVQKIFAKAKADGCVIKVEPGEVEAALSSYVKDKLKGALGFEKEYVYEKHRHLWPEATAARKAQDALDEFDALCEKEARRIVVYKMDLGMKPEKFEAMLAETAKLFE
jgi:hypothetical protein